MVSRLSIGQAEQLLIAYPMNCQNKLVWQLRSVHKILVHLEATSLLLRIKCWEGGLGLRDLKSSRTTKKFIYRLFSILFQFYTNTAKTSFSKRLSTTLLISPRGY